jgi:hypothetical protein
MRFRMAQVVTFTIACLWAGSIQVQAQTAMPVIEADKTCAVSSNSGEKDSSDPEIVVAGVTFSGFLRMPVSAQDEIAASIKERTHRGPLDQATDELLEIARVGWQDHGYFKAEVNGYATTLDSTLTRRRITLSVHVDEGLQYTLGKIRFTHNRAVSNVKALRALFPIDDGNIFSKEKIGIGLENLHKAYGELGYMNFTPVPNTRFDNGKKLIYLDIDVDEGKQFYVDSINIIGLEEAARQELLKELPITPGQIFNSRLWELSLLKLRSRFPNCGCADRQMRALDERAGTVTLTFDFRSCLGVP